MATPTDKNIVDIAPDQVVEQKWDEAVNPNQDGIEAYGSGTSLVSKTFQSANFTSGSIGWQFDSAGNLEANDGNFRGDITGATGTFSGSVTVSSLHVGGDDATSAHIDTDGNFWTGAGNSDFATAPAKISNAGAAHFENVEIGGDTIQYVITNSGIFSFGDGSDGTVTFADQGTAPTGSTKTDNTAGATIYRLDRDVYYDSCTVNATVTINPNGYRLFVKDTLTLNGTISRNGNNGYPGGDDASGTYGSAGAGGAALSDGYLKGAVAGGNGSTGQADFDGTNAGIGLQNGDNVTNSLGSNGSAGGSGGAGQFSGTSQPGGTGGTATPANVKLIANWHLATLLDISSTGSTVKFTTSAGSGGGRGGSGEQGGGGGGGGGSPAGVIAIYARSIVIGANGSITANGGVGGDGGDGTSQSPTSQGAGGGGGGGNGGIIVLAYNNLTNSGSITASGGTGGSPGGVYGGGATAGTNGSTGTIYQFELSL